MYIANVIGSCLILPLLRENDKSVRVFGFLNFCLQIFSLYKRQNFFLYNFYRLLKLFFSLKQSKFRCNENEELILNLAGSTNEVMIAITITIMNIIIFGKTYKYPSFTIGENKKNSFCRKKLEIEVTIGAENLCFLFIINCFFFLYLIMQMKDKRRSVFSWKIENYNVFTKTLYFIMIYAFIDSNFQYYLYLFLLDKN